MKGRKKKERIQKRRNKRKTTTETERCGKKKERRVCASLHQCRKVHLLSSFPSLSTLLGVPFRVSWLALLAFFLSRSACLFSLPLTFLSLTRHHALPICLLLYLHSYISCLQVEIESQLPDKDRAFPTVTGFA